MRQDFQSYLTKEDEETDKLIDAMKDELKKVDDKDDDDENMLFCKSIARQMATLDANKNALLRLKIQQLIYEAQVGKLDTPTRACSDQAPATFSQLTPEQNMRSRGNLFGNAPPQTPPSVGTINPPSVAEYDYAYFNM